MDVPLTIGALAKASGVPARTIRFYEAEGVLPASSRTASGYRVYAQNDVRRLRLLRQARELGLTLTDARDLVQQAFASDCSAFVPELAGRIAAARADVRRRIGELRALHAELEELERHVAHAACATVPGSLVAECDYCPVIDEGDQSMTEQTPDRATLDVLACAIELRPREAPSLMDIAKHIERRERGAGAITVRFARAGSDSVAEFVAAERTCCSTIGWDLVREPDVVLTITATPEQLDVFEGLLAGA